jgi:hypothetical protein
MGLDISHGAWSGSYGAFSRWRQKIAQVAGIPPLQFMEGFWQKGRYDDPFREMACEAPNIAATFYDSLPIKWDILKADPLHILLYHSDCDGEIAPDDCKQIADRLEELLPLLEGDGGGHIGNYREKTQTFIDGLRLAVKLNEPIEFR